MTKLAWAARGLSAVSGAVLLGALLVPSAAASGGMDPHPQPKKKASHPAKAKPAKPVQQAGMATPVRNEDDDRDDYHKKCSTSRDLATAAIDTLPDGPIFRVTTDRHGHAFLNDSRNPGVWVNLGILAHAPTCVTDTAASVTETLPGHLYISLLARDGVLHQATCVTSVVPFTPANLPGVCGTGFTPVQDTPV
ncbi:hypothetical protein ACGFY6_09135 [Streptomyces sp. NPDC048387]|uniref:hypothetical protein n=1 Tax=unclassified Streptomyces TaxID=2593676 RepID=UPI0033F5E714